LVTPKKYVLPRVGTGGGMGKPNPKRFSLPRGETRLKRGGGAEEGNIRVSHRVAGRKCKFVVKTEEAGN